MSIGFRVCSAANFIVAFISIAIQSTILARYVFSEDPGYTKTGVGLWTGVILATTAVSLWLTAIKAEDSTSRIDTVSYWLCVLSILTSLAMIGITSATINVINKILSTDILNSIRPLANVFYDSLEARKCLEIVLLVCGLLAVVIETVSLCFMNVDANIGLIGRFAQGLTTILRFFFIR